MILWREGRVAEVGRGWGEDGAWAGAVELEVEVVSGGAWTRCRALAYPGLVGRPEVGERVLLNTTALERGLGTGGYAIVIARPDHYPVDPVQGPGHLVKARYTPHQAMVLGVDEQESPHHAVLADAHDLLGMPVVVADLHSALPAIVAGVREERPASRIAYVMTDGGALPAWFSQTIALRGANWLTTCITTGQSFGGDLEAVTVHSALLAARHVVDADLAIVIQGPGNLGTGTRWGFSGIAAGEAINAASVLRGHPVAALRVSGADLRERHRGVSHHSLTAYGQIARESADVVVPVFDGPTAALGGGLAELGELVTRQALEMVADSGRHRAVHVGVDGLMTALGSSPVPLSTMGRTLADDPAAFLASAAAGRHAGRLLPD